MYGILLVIFLWQILEEKLWHLIGLIVWDLIGDILMANFYKEKFRDPIPPSPLFSLTLISLPLLSLPHSSLRHLHTQTSEQPRSSEANNILAAVGCMGRSAIAPPSGEVSLHSSSSAPKAYSNCTPRTYAAQV